MRYCDLYLAITGNYWFKRIGQSGFAHWQPKMRHLDLAVDRGDFPPIKQRFNPPGQRKFVYIGKDAWYKNVAYLSEVARLARMDIAWIGSGSDYPGLRKLGRLDFATSEARQVVSEYDFLVTVGKADGNPTTILEAMSWGLIPVCTPQSGYEGYESIVNIPLGDAAGSVRILRNLQEVPESTLHRYQLANWRLLEDHFNWDRIGRDVIDAIEDTSSPLLGKESFKRRLEIRWAEIRSPYWGDYLDPNELSRRLRRYLTSRPSNT
jgi:glycosyltransferase involved in cell wall biosynthesis